MRVLQEPLDIRVRVPLREAELSGGVVGKCRRIKGLSRGVRLREDSVTKRVLQEPLDMRVRVPLREAGLHIFDTPDTSHETECDDPFL